MYIHVCYIYIFTLILCSLSYVFFYLAPKKCPVCCDHMLETQEEITILKCSTCFLKEKFQQHYNLMQLHEIEEILLDEEPPINSSMICLTDNEEFNFDSSLSSLPSLRLDSFDSTTPLKLPIRKSTNKGKTLNKPIEFYFGDDEIDEEDKKNIPPINFETKHRNPLSEIGNAGIIDTNDALYNINCHDML